MPPLEALIADASALLEPAPQGGAALSPVETEAARILRICNACRYCEGFCAMFPAMTRRLEFGGADLHYLANLCHGCGACLHACQYAPPHEFAVNVPRTLARLRVQTYRRHAWPRALGTLYARNGLALSLALAGGIALFLLLALSLRGTLVQGVPGAAFYRVFPHALMAALFGMVFAYALLALGVAVTRFWREAAPGSASAAALADAAGAVATLRYLEGGHGQGCNNEDDRFSLARRAFHQATFYGFLLCFASTLVAALYAYALHRAAPYPRDSLAPLLGIVGGIAIVVGTLGLLHLNLRRDPLQGDPAQKPMDRGFIALLLGTAASGLALTVWRASAAMPALLALHLGAVLALFITLPYGKFAHAPMRAVALLKWAIERRQPARIRLAED